MNRNGPTKTHEVVVLIGGLVGRDRKSQASLRKMVRLLKHVERIELSARQVVHHAHAVQDYSPRQVHSLLLGKGEKHFGDDFRVALAELEKNL
jgi:hypothetical protein